MKKIVVPALLTSLLLAGCSNTIRGGPSRVYTVPDSLEALADVRTDLNKHCLKSGAEAADKKKRNEIVDRYLFLANLRYNAFENALLKESRSGNFSASALSLGLSAVGGLASEGTAQTLTILDGGLKGATESFGKDFLFNQTIPALLTQMQSSRAKAAETILIGKSKSIEDWSLCSTLTDLLAFEQAGTLTAAITNLTQTAADQKRSSEEDASRVKFISSPEENIISNYADENLPPDKLKERLQNLMLAMRNAGLGSSEIDFFRLAASGSASDRAKLISELSKIETDPGIKRDLILPQGE